MDRPTAFQMLEPEAPSGIGGWLVLPLIGLIGTAVNATRGFFAETLPTLRPETWQRLTSPESPAYSGYWAPYVFVSGLLNLLLAGGSVVLLVLFLRKKAQLPFGISLFYGAMVMSAAFEAVSLGLLSQELPDLFEPSELRTATTVVGRSAAAALIWVWYFKVSKRVRNTFVR